MVSCGLLTLASLVSACGSSGGDAEGSAGQSGSSGAEGGAAGWAASGGLGGGHGGATGGASGASGGSASGGSAGAGAHCGNGTLEAPEACDDGNAVSGDGCELDCSLSPEVITCDTLASTSTTDCEFAPGVDPGLRLKGTVLTPERVYRGGQVVLDAQGKIACVGCGCAQVQASAATVTCPTGVISPGLINLDEHLTYDVAAPVAPATERYEHRHDWRRGLGDHTKLTVTSGNSTAALVWSELRQLMAGTTSVVGYGSAAGLVRNLDVPSQSGIPLTMATESFPLGDSSGATLTSGCAYPSITSADSFAAATAYQFRAGEGIDARAANELRCLSTDGDGGVGLYGTRAAVAGAVAADAPALFAMAATGTGLIWSPRSNLALYGDTVDVRTARGFGIDVSLASQWTPTGSMNLLRELACADSFSRQYLDGALTSRELWLMVTENPAVIAQASSELGALRVGLQGDLVIFDGSTHADYDAVVQAQSKDVMGVFRSGKLLFGLPALVASLRPGAACDALDVCGQSRALCLAEEVGSPLAAISGALSSPYVLTSCGAPPSEPTCVPQRTQPEASVSGSSLYSGELTATDTDGDGLEDSLDDCPRVFNPIRPDQGGVQRDTDGDGLGDPCDPCPLAANTTDCPAPSVDDLDGDGTLNAEDLCPYDYDPEQLDGDQDGHGDACDACPAESNPGTSLCSTSLYALNQGEVALGALRLAEPLIVTAVRATGAYAQVDPSVVGYSGAEYSGIWLQGTTALSVGDVIQITSATAADYYGMRELTQCTVVVEGTGVTVPPLDVSDQGDLNQSPVVSAVQGVLIALADGLVLSVDDVNGTFVVDFGGWTLQVDSELYAASALPAVGDVLTSLQGLAHLSQGTLSVSPRSESDWVLAP